MTDKETNRLTKKKRRYPTPKKPLSDFYYSLEDYLNDNSLSSIYQFQTHHLGESIVILRGTTVGQDHLKVSVYITTTL